MSPVGILVDLAFASDRTTRDALIRYGGTAEISRRRAALALLEHEILVMHEKTAERLLSGCDQSRGIKHA